MDTSIRQQVREPNAYIGSRIRLAREIRRFSQERLGAEIGVTFQQMQKYENGKTRVSACSLVAIAKVLGFEVGYFLPAGAEPIGAFELEAIRRDVEASRQTVRDAIDRLTALSDRLAATADRLAASCEPPS